MRHVTRAVLALVLAAASVVRAVDAQGGPRFVLSPKEALVDEVIHIALGGFPARHEVTVRLAGLGDAARWRASAQFQTDAAGDVRLASAAPIGGDYSGAHAMGLFWSARPDSGARPLIITAVKSPEVVAPTPQSWQLIAEVDGRVVAMDTVRRRAISPGVVMKPVRDHGIVGTLYVPPGSGRHPAVIVLNGSDGGIAPASDTPGGLSSRGYVVLSARLLCR